MGINNAVNTSALYRTADSWGNISKVVRENKIHKKHEFEKILSLCLEKEEFPEAGKAFIYQWCAFIPLSGEGEMQTLAIHTHLAAGNHIHFAIFFL